MAVDCRECQQFDSCYYDYDENCIGFLPSSPQKLQREKQKAIANERLQRYWVKKESNPSNYDRVISKTPEELAEWLTPVKCVDCHLLDCGVGEIGNNKTCTERILDWLRQEVKEVKDTNEDNNSGVAPEQGVET